jgi:hypothetical protein
MLKQWVCLCNNKFVSAINEHEDQWSTYAKLLATQLENNNVQSKFEYTFQPLFLVRIVKLHFHANIAYLNSFFNFCVLWPLLVLHFVWVMPFVQQCAWQPGYRHHQNHHILCNPIIPSTWELNYVSEMHAIKQHTVRNVFSTVKCDDMAHTWMHMPMRRNILDAWTDTNVGSLCPL